MTANGEGKDTLQVTLLLTVEHIDGPYRTDDAVAQAAAEAIAGETLELGRVTRSRYVVDSAEVIA